MQTSSIHPAIIIPINITIIINTVVIDIIIMIIITLTIIVILIMHMIFIVINDFPHNSGEKAKYEKLSKTE